MRRIEARREVFKPTHMRVHGVVDYDELATEEEVIETMERWMLHTMNQVAQDFESRQITDV